MSSGPILSIKRVVKIRSFISVGAGLSDLNVTGIELLNVVVYGDDSVYDRSSDKCVHAQ